MRLRTFAFTCALMISAFRAQAEPLSVPAGTAVTNVSLVNGTGSFGGPDRATDLGDTILVDIGAAQLAIKKHGFNLIDRASVGGVEIVPPGTSLGVVLTGNDDTQFS